jgi:hypothetical protein
LQFCYNFVTELFFSILFFLGQRWPSSMSCTKGETMSGNRQRRYTNMSRERIASVMAALRRSGVRISGENPWEIDTLRHGVHLAAAWSEVTEVLALTITDRNWYVSSDDVWNTIDPLLEEVGSLSSG